MKIKKAKSKSDFKLAKSGEMKFGLMVRAKPVVASSEGNYKNLYLLSEFENIDDLQSQIEEITSSDEIRNILKVGEMAEFMYITDDKTVTWLHFSLDDMV